MSHICSSLHAITLFTFIHLHVCTSLGVCVCVLEAEIVRSGDDPALEPAILLFYCESRMNCGLNERESQFNCRLGLSDL